MHENMNHERAYLQFVVVVSVYGSFSIIVIADILHKPKPGDQRTLTVIFIKLKVSLE